MSKVSNNTKVMLTIVISLVVAYLGYRVMKDLPLFSGSKIIYTHFKKVDGLTTGSYVFISGVKVGSVRKMKIVGADSVEVSLSFDDVQINKGSVAYLQSSGLLGDKAIYLQKGDSPKMVEDGDTIKGVYSGGMMETFQKKGTKLADDASSSFDKLNQTLTQLQQIVDQDNKRKIDQTLGNLQQSTSEVSKLMQHKRQKLESSINHAHDFLANLDTVTTDNKARIDSALTGIDRSMQHLDELTADLQKTNGKLRSILTKMDNGKGSLGKMVNDPSLYNHLDSLSVGMNNLIKNINRDPAKYLKGLKLIDIF